MKNCIYVVVSRDEQIGDTELSYHEEEEKANAQLPLRRISNPTFTYFVKLKKVFGLNPED